MKLKMSFIIEEEIKIKTRRKFCKPHLQACSMCLMRQILSTVEIDNDAQKFIETFISDIKFCVALPAVLVHVCKNSYLHSTSTPE